MTDQTALNEVLAHLPHRVPFRFVSELCALESSRATGAWHVSGVEAFLAGHFPGEPIVPGVLVVEALAQLAGLVWMGESGHADARARLARVDVKILSAVTPPARVDLTARMIRSMDNMAMFDVEATVGDVRAAVGSLVLARAPVNGVSP